LLAYQDFECALFGHFSFELLADFLRPHPRAARHSWLFSPGLRLGLPSFARFAGLGRGSPEAARLAQAEIVPIEGIWEQNGRAFPDLRLKTDFHNKNQSQKPQKCVLCE